VVHVIDSLDVGGAQELVATLSTCSSPGAFAHRCAALHGPGEDGRELEAAGVPVVYLASRRRELTSILGGWRHLRRLEPAIVNLHLEVSTLVGLLLWTRRIPARFVVTLHALKSQLPFWFHPALRRVVGRAAAVIVEDRVALAEVRALGYPVHRIHHISIGVDLGRFPAGASGASVRQELRLSPADRVVLNIGRLVPMKGQAELIRAMQRVVRSLPDARLVLVGDGPSEASLRRLTARLGLEDSVVITGRRRDLAALYGAADLFAVSSRKENMGVVVYQAMAAGLAVVAYAAGSIDEAVLDGETGHLVRTGDVAALADRLIELLEDPRDAALALGRAGRARAEAEFSSRRMVERYETVYRHVLEGD
jgi:glycosyltransferase involved in cell wall biosynthesis